MADVLIVDDEEDICDELKESLEEIGLTSEIALTGEDAIRLMDQGQWRLFVVDLKLSTRITGLDVIKTIKERWPNAVVAAMTGYVDIGLKQEAEKLGVNAFLRKPDDIQYRVFKKIVRELLHL